MKKFMKVCGITALIFLVLGIVLAVSMGTIRGRLAIERALETVTGGRVSLDFDGLWGWGSGSQYGIGNSLPDVDYDIDDVTSFDSQHEILGADVPKFCLGEEVKALNIEAGGCAFYTAKSTDNSFYVEASDTGRFQAYLEDGTLYIRVTTSSRSWEDWGRWETCQVRLYVPEGYCFSDAEVELGAGLLEFEGLNADKVFLKVGAGRVKVDGLTADSLETEVGMGQIELYSLNVKGLAAEIGMGELVARGTVAGNAKVDCSMGNVDMELTGRREDFNYELRGAMGSISLESSRYSGFGMSRTIDNGAEKEIDAECSAGNITIKFTD